MPPAVSHSESTPQSVRLGRTGRASPSLARIEPATAPDPADSTGCETDTAAFRGRGPERTSRSDHTPSGRHVAAVVGVRTRRLPRAGSFRRQAGVVGERGRETGAAGERGLAREASGERLRERGLGEEREVARSLRRGSRGRRRWRPAPPSPSGCCVLPLRRAPLGQGAARALESRTTGCPTSRTLRANPAERGCGSRRRVGATRHNGHEPARPRRPLLRCRRGLRRAPRGGSRRDDRRDRCVPAPASLRGAPRREHRPRVGLRRPLPPLSARVRQRIGPGSARDAPWHPVFRDVAPVDLRKYLQRGSDRPGTTSRAGRDVSPGGTRSLRPRPTAVPLRGDAPSSAPQSGGRSSVRRALGNRLADPVATAYAGNAGNAGNAGALAPGRGRLRPAEPPRSRPLGSCS